MQDRPTYDELLAAVERFLDEEIVPNSEGARRFHGRVAANVIRIVRRELEREEEQLAGEWAGLDGLLGPAEQPQGRSALRDAIAARTEELCGRIRAGEADSGPFRAAVLAHLRRAVRDKLLVSNPAWLEEKTS
ncbi:MAG: hypothetical protein A2148_02750 [Chloroflexi bacterium RBG_16_68_14]|nr:MAG: hypothetical protein A2148_02750 [Chloroflexi bacterium RBG_16_68_14]